MKPVYLTKEELGKIQKDLHKLKYVDRPKMIEAIATAREHGDLKENAEYKAAKENQVLLEIKIQRLEIILSRVRIIDTKNIDNTKAHVGSKVTLLNIDTEQTMTYIIASTADLDLYDIDVLSLESPVGKLIIGKSVGDLIEIDPPPNQLVYKILKIS